MSTELPTELPTELSAERTPVTAEQAAYHLARAYRTVGGQPPTREVLGLLLAQWALETDTGRAMWNYNFGNAKFSSRDAHYQYLKGCFEYVDGVRQTYGARAAACKFAAFTSPSSGALAFVRLLARRAHWWRGLHTGTTAGFVRGLTTSPAYFTAGADKYRRGLDSRLAQLSAVVARHEPGTNFFKFADALAVGAGAAGVAWLALQIARSRRGLARA